MKLNLKRNFEFNPFKERGIEEQVRLVIYNNETSEFSIKREIAPKGQLNISYDELENHLNYRFKYQIKKDGRWGDIDKYTRLIPESITEEGIKYLLYKNPESKKLIVIFQAISTTPSYNYIKTIKDEHLNKLYIKDDYGEDEATKSSYYLGKHKNLDIFNATQNLITEVIDYLGIEKKDVIFAGSSKGGYAALHHGYHFGCGYILPGGPQVLLGDYLGRTAKKSILAPIFRSIVGEVNEENKEWANKLMYNALKNAQKPHPKTLIHIGSGEPHYQSHVIPFMKWVKELKIENVELDILDYDTHKELAIHYPIFLKEQVNKICNEQPVSSN